MVYNSYLKIMKKLFYSLIMLVAMSLTFVACDGGNTPGGYKPGKNESNCEFFAGQYSVDETGKAMYVFEFATNGLDPIKDPLHGKEHRGGHDQQRHHHQTGLGTAGPKVKQAAKGGEAENQAEGHGPPNDFAEFIEGRTYLVQHQHANNRQDRRADRGDLVHRDPEGHHEGLRHEDHEDIRQTARERSAQNAGQKFSRDPLVIRLHRQEKAGDTDGQRGDHAQMEGHHGICPCRQQRDQRKTQ